MHGIARFAPPVLSLYIAVVFVQSLFFKFAGSPETRHIFGTLDRWAADVLGAEGLFLPPGPFNAYVIGSVELLAALLLLGGLVLRRPLLRFAGAFLALDVITGAVFFHLFTPLGVVVLGDGGLLFAMAVGVLLAAVWLLLHDARELGLLRRARAGAADAGDASMSAPR